MARFSPERWRTLSPYLDRALDTTDTAWRESLRTENPTLAADLEVLLAELAALRSEGFLEDGPPRPAESSLAGQVIGAYTLLSLLGQGGTGSVWLARRDDGWFVGQVALKLLHPVGAGPVGEERFKREGRILAKLKHPHIAHLLDAGVASGQPYLVLEHVEGEPIDAYCDRRRLGVEARVRLVVDVLDAVAHAHAKLIVHRDIKPSNVLVTAEGRVKLLDFGIAKLIEAEPGSSELTALTREGSRALTPAYAAPEQLEDGTITIATDVHAVGVLLYLLLTGRHPAGAALRTPAELVKAIVEIDPPPPSVAAGSDGPQGESALEAAAQRATSPERLQRTLRGDLDTIVAKALKKAPEERYASSGALAEDLRRYLGHEPIAARPDSLRYRAAKFVRRNRFAAASSAFVLLALLVGLGGTIWQARVAARQRDLALVQYGRAERINEFNYFLLAEAVPGGRPVTMREILTRAERVVGRQFESDEALSVELLTTIGGIYAVRQQDAEAGRILKRAYEASQQIADPAVRANATCNWARVVGTSGDFEGGKRLVDSALALTSAEERFDRIVAVCLLVRANIATEEGVPAVVVDSAQKALARVEGKPSAVPVTRADALESLAIGLAMQGDIAGSSRLYGQALDLLARMGRQDAADAGFVLHNWAMNLGYTSPLDALAMHRRMIAIFEGADPDAVPMPGRLNCGIALNRLGRYAEARTSLELVRAQARRQDNPTMLAISSLAIACASRNLGDLAAARAALAQAAATLQPFPAGHRARADLAREQGLLAAAEGRSDEARRLLSSALAIHEHVREKHASHVETLLALAGLELRLGSGAEAARHARAALAVAESFRGGAAASAWVGLSQLALGEIAETSGDAPAARPLFEQALGHMVPTLGEAHPAVVEARTRLVQRSGTS
jgi:serine/threonine-protein kinase